MIQQTLIVALISALLGAGGTWYFQGKIHDGEIATIKANQLVAVNAAITGARTQEQERFKGVQNAQTNNAKRVQIAEADASNTRTELERLRDFLRSQPGVLSGESAAACYSRADKLATVFSECAGAFVEMEGNAITQSNNVKLLLEAWPK